jgi:hypothetical protein
MVLAGRRGRRSVAESEASKRESRLGSGEKSSIEGSKRRFWCRQLLQNYLGEGSVFIFLGLNLIAQGSVRGRQKVGSANNAWVFLLHRQGCAMFIRFFSQWPSLDQVIESFRS